MNKGKVADRRTICCSESILRREVQPHRIPSQDAPSVGPRVLSRMFQHRGEGCWSLQQEPLLSATLSLFTAQEDIEAQITATQRTAASPATLKVTSGAPLSFFDPATWPACFVKFVYGDCAPNLDRPVKLGWRRLFRYLMNREELEYHLASDLEDPLIPGGRYKGPSQSRWNTPEFAAVFVDTVRKLEVLQSTKGFFAKHQQTFAQDLRLIAKATDKDFEQFQANLRASERGASVPALIVAAKQQKMPGVQKVLQHLLMHTTSVAMTEGNKMTIRHRGQAMNLRFGPFSSFFTTNFADTYNPLTVVLHQGAGEPLGKRSLDIRQDSPPMPTSQDMHKMVAAHPMTQANLFMLLDALTHQHLLCVRNVFLGRRKYDPCYHWQREPPTEDDFASTGDFGVAGMARGVVKALEAQGRGFAHGHEKIHSEPQTKAIDFWDLITRRCCGANGDSSNDGASEHFSFAGAVIDQWMRKHRDECLLDASTKQYDSSIECGRQFGIPDLKEVFAGEDKQALLQPTSLNFTCEEIGGTGKGEVCCCKACLPSLASSRSSLRRSACGADLMADARKMAGSENWRRLFRTLSQRTCGERGKRPRLKADLCVMRTVRSH